MAQVYYGQETSKAVENFHLTGTPVSLQFVRALALVKQAAAEANFLDQRLPLTIKDAIVQAAQEVVAGKFDDYFVTDAIQGGAGTSLNMNVNEVIAARATELLNGEPVHYLDHVNLAQSTNDAVPTALKITILQLLDEYLASLAQLEKTFRAQAKKYAQVLKVGRTHLQDAVPVTLGQEFGAYAELVQRDGKRLQAVKEELYVTNLGGTAIGTGINASAKYTVEANLVLAALSGYPLRPADDLIDATQNVDSFIHVAYLVQLSALGLSKIANDLRMMASGPRAGLHEITVPELQKGSTIMAGKVNPIQLEALNQVAYQVSGNAQVASLVLLNGQFELNVMLPVFSKTIIESLTLLTRAVEAVIPTIRDITVHEDHCRQLFEHSTVTATAFNRILGYDKTAEIVKRALKSGKSFKEEIIAEGVMSVEQVEKVMQGKE